MVLGVVAEQTGYPADMLELDLDLEADLGIDTVKQAETFAAIREHYEIARDDNLSLRDYPTLAHVVDFVRDRANLPATVPVRGRRTAPAASATRGTAAATAAPAPAEAAADPVVAMVLVGRGRTDRLPRRHARARPRPRSRPRHRHRQTSRNLRRHPRALRHRTRRQPLPTRLPHPRPRRRLRPRHAPTSPPLCPWSAAAPAAASAPAAPAATAAPAPAEAAADPVVAMVLSVVAEQTGYPADMLELDLDLEADLGIDTVKQAETFAAIRDALRHRTRRQPLPTRLPHPRPRRRLRPRPRQPPRHCARGGRRPRGGICTRGTPRDRSTRAGEAAADPVVAMVSSWWPNRPATPPTCSSSTSTSKPTSASTPSNKPKPSPPSASTTRSHATTTSPYATTPPSPTSSASSATAPTSPPLCPLDGRRPYAAGRHPCSPAAPARAPHPNARSRDR